MSNLHDLLDETQRLLRKARIRSYWAAAIAVVALAMSVTSLLMKAQSGC